METKPIPLWETCTGKITPKGKENIAVTLEHLYHQKGQQREMPWLWQVELT